MKRQSSIAGMMRYLVVTLLLMGTCAPLLQAQAAEKKPAKKTKMKGLLVAGHCHRDQLVVCGDPEFILEVGGPDLARRLNIPS